MPEETMYWIHDVTEGMTIHQDSCRLSAERRHGPFDAETAALAAQAFAAALKVYNCQHCGGSKKLTPLDALEAVSMLGQFRKAQVSASYRRRTGLMGTVRQKMDALFGRRDAL